jgi:signal transduction histidine kinase/ActR/RegA family two-component response regulator
MGMVHDVTERKRAEENVERARLGLSRLAEASLSVMARTDLEGMLQAVAEAALALTGARLATCGHGLVGGQLMVGGSARAPGAPACPPGNMFQLERGGVHLELIERAGSLRLGDEELRAHSRWWGLPGGHVPLRGLLGVRMQGRSGQTSGLILVTDKEQGDFTEEDESLLGQLATVASLALQHVEARISLEDADRRKNQFLAMLSHELRNPLAPIRNSLHLLEQAAPGSEQARRAQAVIGRQVGHMVRLVEDLLDVTRVSSGKVQLQREQLDLADVVRRAVEDHRQVFAAHGLELVAAIPEGPIPIDGDRTRISQVVGNLLQNSWKFTPAGGRVTVTVEASEPLGQAIARVRDTGAGIAPEMLPRLFEPFTQADTTLDRSKGGLGLGLSLAKGLVEMHGGTVSAASEGPGKGAEFTIRLPLHRGPGPRAEPQPRERPAAPGRRVLIVEDNVDSAESLRDVLEIGGHVVQVAHSGAAGLELAHGFRPEVVLCDVGLPGIDGYGVARSLRADPVLACVTLVALTGYAAPDDVARSKEAGFDLHLAKPVDVEELDRILRGDAGSAA